MRNINFTELDSALAECKSLLSSGYTRHGKWSLGQMCRHIRLTIEANMQGYPWWMSLALPIRPLMRWLVLPRLLSGRSPKGLPTAPMFVPADGLDDQDEVERLAKCIEDFDNFKEDLHPHPGFGKLSHRGFEEFHAAHLAHHLSFLTPSENADRSGL